MMEEKLEQGITAEDTFRLTFYDYGQPYYGSYCGMRFRLARDPMVNVYGKSKEVKEDGKLIAIIWPGLKAFEYTDEEEKTSAEFPYTEEGKEAAIQWLNEQYEQQKERWTKIYGLFR